MQYNCQKSSNFQGLSHFSRIFGKNDKIPGFFQAGKTVTIFPGAVGTLEMFMKLSPILNYRDITYEKAMVAAANISSVRNTMKPLEYIRTLPNFNIMVSIAMVTDICVNVVKNQASQ